MDYLDRVHQLMESYDYLGRRVLPDGTRLIGHVPHVAPEAYLHVIFPRLSTEQVAEIGNRTGIPVPVVLASFLERVNGLRLFSKLFIDGLRRSYSRSGDDAWQPFAMETPNVDERPRDVGRKHAHLALREVEDARCAMDENEGECERRVDTAVGETRDHVLKEVGHRQYPR